MAKHCLSIVKLSDGNSVKERHFTFCRNGNYMTTLIHGGFSSWSLMVVTSLLECRFWIVVVLTMVSQFWYCQSGMQMCEANTWYQFWFREGTPLDHSVLVTNLVNFLKWFDSAISISQICMTEVPLHRGRSWTKSLKLAQGSLKLAQVCLELAQESQKLAQGCLKLAQDGLKTAQGCLNRRSKSLLFL